MTITRFTLQNQQKQLLINHSDDTNNCLSYEYLRVMPPLLSNANGPVANKKDVLIYNIENVGKHGYRFIFNDSYTCILNNEDINELIDKHQVYWQQYLDALTAGKLSREAKIDIVNLS